MIEILIIHDSLTGHFDLFLSCWGKKGSKRKQDESILYCVYIKYNTHLICQKWFSGYKYKAKRLLNG